MDVFTSRITQNNLNDLIVKYNIPRDLHPRLPPSGLVMFELTNDAIGIYHRSSRRSANKPPTGSYNQSDVRRLSASVTKLCDMPEGVLVLSSLRRVWKSRTHDLILRYLVETRLRFYYTPPAAGGADIPVPTPDDEDSDDDDDVCVEIPLIIHVCSATTIPLRGNQGGGSIPPPSPTAEGPTNLGSQGKTIIDDAADTPFRIAGRSHAFTTPLSELLSLASSTGLERGLHIDQTQEQLATAFKKIYHFVPGAQGRRIEATPLVSC
ncbi:hypothetical protein Tco_0937236, partial [Tanacetum coccineum]